MGFENYNKKQRENFMTTYKRKISLLFVSSLMFAFILSCENPLDPERPNYELTWSDEFEGQAGQLPDPTKWTFDIGTDCQRMTGSILYLLFLILWFKV